jgi:GABA(A) receptor-associated protein
MFSATSKSSSCLFKETHSFDARVSESTRMRKKYPERIPVIVEKGPGDKLELVLDKTKYLVPCDLTVGQLMYVVRKRLKLDETKALFFIVQNTMPTTSSLISTVYEEHKDADGYLYVTYSSENTFGGNLPTVL